MSSHTITYNSSYEKPQSSKLIMSSFFEFLNLNPKKQKDILTDQLSYLRTQYPEYMIEIHLETFREIDYRIKTYDFDIFVINSFAINYIDNEPELFPLMYKFMEFLYVKDPRIWL
jgi:hypothetical protein